jgi:hypothetical protein
MPSPIITHQQYLIPVLGRTAMVHLSDSEMMPSIEYSLTYFEGRGCISAILREDSIHLRDETNLALEGTRFLIGVGDGNDSRRERPRDRQCTKERNRIDSSLCPSDARKQVEDHQHQRMLYYT